MIRHGLTPILFVINNAGYTIEKFIHGKYRYVAKLLSDTKRSSDSFTENTTMLTIGSGQAFWTRLVVIRASLLNRILSARARSWIVF